MANQSVGTVALDGTGSVVVHRTSSPFGMAIDDVSRQAYWLEGVGGVVTSNAALSNPHTLATPTSSSTLSLAIDPAADLVLWTDYSNSTIGRARLSDGLPLGSFATGGQALEDITVDPTSHKVYWTDANSKISRANYDGTNQELLVGTAGPLGTGAAGIDLDLSAGKMYLAYPNSHTITRRNLDGTNVETLLTLNETERPFGMELYASRVYWCDNDNGLLRSATTNGSDVKTVLSGLDSPRAVSILALAGDYNSNGTVDAADYVVWRKGLGTTYTQSDYNVWRANFGAVGGSGSGSIISEAQPSVPEPATLVLLAFGAIYWLAGRRVGHSRAMSILFGVAVSMSSVSAWADVLYVAPFNFPSEIEKVSSTGGVSKFVSLPADSYYPEGLAFDVSGNLYVANDSSGRISKISPSGAVSLFATVSSPVGLAFDASGDLYVVNNYRDEIDKITPSGTVSFFAALPHDTNAIGLAFDSSGTLYVAGSNINQITKVTSSGTSSVFVTLPSGSSPWALAFDGSGDLFLADSSGRIDRITPGGAVSPFVTLPDFPYGLAFDSSGNLYASQYGLGQISKITAAGAVSIFASGIVSPTFIAVTDDAGHPLSLPPATLLGDYNRNGTVDAADYVVWRDGLGTVYNQADYQVWRTHFGQTIGAGTGEVANAAVPEPASIVLLMFAAADWCLRRRRHT